jgi:cell pole-organizing protein PopZ
MEEILASIRKIISEDSTEAPPAAAPAAEADVLELTQEVHEDVPPASVVAETAPPTMTEAAHEQASVTEPETVTPEPAPVTGQEHTIENEVVFQSIEEAPVSEAPAATPAHEGIFSDKTRKALEDSFSSIQPPKAESVAASAAVEAPAQMPDGASVQAVFEKAVRDGFGPVLHQWLADNSDAVVEKLKPVVREWMDEHFPALLEGAVRAEVERVARARH